MTVIGAVILIDKVKKKSILRWTVEMIKNSTNSDNDTTGKDNVVNDKELK